MDSLPVILQMVLNFLLQFVELLVSFVIQALSIFLQFFRALVASVG